MKERLTAAFLNLYFEVRSIETGSRVTRVYDGDVSLMKAGRDKTVLLGVSNPMISSSNPTYGGQGRKVQGS